MLALARGEGQSIIIDGNIEVKIVKWSRSSVRIAIQAPRAISVDRDEIWRKMNPGVLTPLEKAEMERNDRIAQGAALGLEKIKFEDCPKAVQEAFLKEAADTTRTVIRRVEGGKLVYSASAMIDGTMYTLYVAENGCLLRKDPA
jgi:carbon storage regulator CsrA